MKEKAEIKHTYLLQPPRRGDTLDQQRELLGAAALPRGHGYGERRNVDERGAAVVTPGRGAFAGGARVATASAATATAAASATTAATAATTAAAAAFFFSFLSLRSQKRPLVHHIDRLRVRDDQPRRRRRRRTIAPSSVHHHHRSQRLVKSFPFRLACLGALVAARRIQVQPNLFF